MLTNSKQDRFRKVFLVFLAALIVRLLACFIYHQGGYFWQDTANYVRHWFTHFYDNGILNAYGNNSMEGFTRLDYPPLYYLSMYAFVGRPFVEVYKAGQIQDVFLSFFPVTIDAIFVAFLYAAFGKMSALVWMFYPAALLNVSDMAQSDAAFCFLIVLFFLSYVKDKPFWLTSVIFALLCLTKLQGCYFLPIYLYMMFTSVAKWDKRIQGLICGGCVGLAGWLPFMNVERDVFLPFRVYLGGLQKSNMYCYNAANFWYPLGGETYGIGGSVISALLVVLCFAVFFYIARATKDVVFASFVYFFSLFMITLQQHDRYEMYSFTILLLACLFHSKYVNDKMMLLSMAASSLSAHVGWLSFRLRFWLPGVMDPDIAEAVLATVGIILNILLIVETARHFLKTQRSGSKPTETKNQIET